LLVKSCLFGGGTIDKTLIRKHIPGTYCDLLILSFNLPEHLNTTNLLAASIINYPRLPDSALASPAFP
jgi:hypothetical protein